MAAQSTIPLGLVIVVAIVAAWILHKLVEPKPATGTVELGDPTVTGESVVSGTDVYFSQRSPSIELDPSNPAVDSHMRQLIFESSAAIASDDAHEAAGGE